MDKVQELIEQLDNNKFVQIESVIHSLSMMEEDISVYIHEFLKNEKREYVIANLLTVLGKIGDKKSVSLLLQYYKGSDSVVIRRASIKGLADIGDYAIMPYILEALETEKVDIVREELISAIGLLAIAQPLDMLVKNLSAEDSFVREAAAGSIYYLSKHIVDVLLIHLNQANTTDMQVELIEVLRMIRSRRAIPILETMLTDEEKVIRVSAEWALREINEENSSK